MSKPKSPRARFCVTCRRLLGDEEASMAKCCTCAYEHEVKTRAACLNLHRNLSRLADRHTQGVFYERGQKEVMRTNELREANPDISEKDWDKMLRDEFGKE